WDIRTQATRLRGLPIECFAEKPDRRRYLTRPCRSAPGRSQGPTAITMSWLRELALLMHREWQADWEASSWGLTVRSYEAARPSLTMRATISHWPTSRRAHPTV